MERGYIKIKENKDNQLIIEAKLVNCTLWMTKHEIADLLNVFVSSVGNNLRSIFNSGLLHKEDVTRIHKYEDNGRRCEMTLYNLETLIFVSYRTASFEAQAFREWVMKALTEYTRTQPKREAEVLVVYNYSNKLTSVILN
ncbi:virulence RhuM family protein [Massilibacteroides vaginae]|uniref:virulence RhuM family protein n=1 Tax=Massilibacteroides vaginae TaxID=1673718 RepID=UPI000A1CBB0C|nr:virulence RhuM family protein [Massilibacteroides vaginae]